MLHRCPPWPLLLFPFVVGQHCSSMIHSRSTHSRDKLIMTGERTNHRNMTIAQYFSRHSRRLSHATHFAMLREKYARKYATDIRRLSVIYFDDLRIIRSALASSVQIAFRSIENAIYIFKSKSLRNHYYS